MVDDLFDPTDKTAIVTGGSRGIGKAIGRAYAESGANLIITSRNEEELKSACEEINNHVNTRVEYYSVDLRDRKHTDQMTSWALSEFGVIDILVNNAGDNSRESLVGTTDKSWDNLVEINLTSAMRLSRALAPQMIEQKWGRIIYTSSIMAFSSNLERGAYSATKAGLVGMTRAQALELGPAGITVNCLAPGPVTTDMTMRMLDEETKRGIANRIALKRWGTTVDIIGPAIMLASEAGSFITGETIVVDGGLLARAFGD